LKPDLQYQ